MGRYTGTLHKLIDSASTSNSKTKWNQVLHYLEGHTVANNTSSNPSYDSPLPPYSSPSVELEVELFDQQGPKREDSPLKIAIKTAPAVIIAALCHLGPEAAKLADSRDRLPIHWACRRPGDDKDTEMVISILTMSAPETLLHRDDGGRTPLHWLFWYHAPLRSPKLVKFLCQSLPPRSFREVKQPRDSHNERYPLPEIPIPDGTRDGIPANAAIIPDARHGALPLHYAVMQGASKEVMKILIAEYPDSISYGDRKGRTALAWYLGAGHLLDNNKRHICGEANDPNATAWWYVKLSPVLIQLLLTSKVARAVDDMNRTALHWACHFYARSTMALGTSSLPLKAFQLLLDNNIEAVTTQDCDGKTPLHILFDVVAEQHDNEFQRLVANRTLRENVDFQSGGPPGFKPAKELIELLLKSPDADGQDQAFRFDTGRESKKPSTASQVEDMNGLLPLHNALRVATSPEIVQLLIQSNPTGLIHASEDELQTPLVHAFCAEYSAPLQSVQTFDLLMAAYVTSRHGTFIDGRVAMKMEDASGTYPMHYACQNQACVEIIRLFVDKFPHSAVNTNAEGDLPLHNILSQDSLFDAPNGMARGATLAANFIGLQTDKEVAWHKNMKEIHRQKIKILIEPLRTPQHLKAASSAHGMTPLHVAIAFRAVPYDTIYRMVDTYPEAVCLTTTAKGYEFSCMDLHEMNKEDSTDSEEWDSIRELLFAFNPKLEDYRKREDLLDACVRLVRNEISGKGSYHLTKTNGQKVTRIASLEIKDTLSSIAVPEIDGTYRPKSKKNKEVKSKRKNAKKEGLTMKIANSLSFGKEKKVEKSIYDDDLGDRYVVSPENSGEEGEDDDDDFLSSYEDDEDESYSDSDSGSGTGFNRSSSYDHSSNRSSWDQGSSSGPSGTFTDSAESPRSALSPASAVSGRSGASSPSKMSRRSQHERPAAATQHIEEKKEEQLETTVEEEDIALSDVAMRMWCFFVLYNDTKNPEDNYIEQVEAITEEMDFDVLEELMNLPVPEYAEAYLEEGISTAGVTLRDVASPTSKALFRSFQYFLGRYEFPTETEGLLLHRNIDGNTVFIKATEHIIRTEEYVPRKEFAPGLAEEAIWATGEQVEEEGGYVASKFVDRKRSVFFKVTMNQEAYDNEIRCREHLGLMAGKHSLRNVLPLFDNYSNSEETKKGRKYIMDVNDERFQTLSLFGGESIKLSDFPYAMVYPYSSEGDLFDYFYHHGLDGTEEISDIGAQVAAALKMLHEKGVVHGNLSIRDVKLVPFDDENARRTWAVSDFSTSSQSQAEAAFMGTISHNGSAQFVTGLLPPEMFVKLTAEEARIYKTYWEMVERLYKVKVDKRVVEPFVNLQTGATYALRCHFVPGDKKLLGVFLPELPYQLVPARESTDIWCFGLILFVLCSGGRPLFPSNLRTGHLLDYESIVGWNKASVSSKVYEHIEDPIAQDLLLQLLAPYDERVELPLEKILNHPFFNKSADKSTLLGKMIDKRQNESAAHDRRRQQVVTEKSGDNWLDSRTTRVECWNFDLLRKFNFSAAETIGKLMGQKSMALSMPCNLVLLPYKLSAKNKKAKLAPTTKKDVERAERMGVLLLELAKACAFACEIKSVVSSNEGQLWTVSKIMDQLELADEGFQTVKSDFTKFATSHVEAFRANPVSSATKVVERRIMDLRKTFKEAGKAFLYLVDEHAGIPLVGGAYAPYPMEVSESLTDKFLIRALPFMYNSVMYARGTSGGVSGVVRLIFEAAYPHVPPSWAISAQGLEHRLDEDAFANEIGILRDALALVYSSSKANKVSDDLRFIRDSCLKIDTRGSFADMQRVLSAGCSLWTTKEGAAEIQESCHSYGFKEALDIQSSLESQLRSREQQIKRLQEEMERLSFRKELNLDVPDATASTRAVSNVTVPKQVAVSQIPGIQAAGSLALSQQSSADEFFDSKCAPSFDEVKGSASLTQVGTGNDESTQGKSDTASLREQISLD